MLYLVKTPWWLKKLYPSFTWTIKGEDKVLYLTFDDGPHETVTSFVLDELKKYNAKATFFCIGKNVAVNKELYQRIIDEGHQTGNHTNHHLNGWKTNKKTYLEDIEKASELIKSDLFRPPYGRITRSQARQIMRTEGVPSRIIMWDVLSGDFDTSLHPDKCVKNVTDHARQGSIIVFHDSEKAFERMSYALPRVLEYFNGKGYRFESISQ